MNDDIFGLVKAVYNHPGEHAPISGLADELLGRGDGRGEILRRWLVGDRAVGRLLRSSEDPYHEEKWEEPFDDEFTDEYRLQTSVHRPMLKGKGPVFAVHIKGPKTESFTASVVVPAAEARAFADRLPHAKAVHAFLDGHLGDPTKYAADYGDALSPDGR